MKKRKLVTQPTDISSMQFDVLDSYADNWEVRAERLHASESRKLRHQEM